MESATLPYLLTRQCVQVTVVAVLVWIAVKFFATDRPHLVHALWGLVLLKCVFPPLIASPLGAFCWLDSTFLERRSVVGSALEPNRSLSDMPLLESAELSPILRMQRLPRVQVASPDYGDREPQHRGPRELLAVVEATDVDDTSLRTLLWLWCLGTALGLSSTSLKLLRFLRRVNSATITTPDHVARLILDLQARLRVRRRIRIHVVNSSIGPAVVGILRPTILLPKSLIENRSDEQLVPLLAHELIHIRRGDLLWAFLQTLAVRIWWFHPLVAFAGRMLEREAERSCDEETIGNSDVSRAPTLAVCLRYWNKSTGCMLPRAAGRAACRYYREAIGENHAFRTSMSRRSPYWMLLVIAIGASTALPGAAWVVGQDDLLVKEESHSAENEIPSSSARWQVLPGSAVLPVHETVTSDLDIQPPNHDD